MSKMKYVLTAALVALCVTLASGAVFAQTWSASAQDIPSGMAWGRSYSGSVTAENTGAATWDVTYDLRSVEGVTPACSPVDRWDQTVAMIAGVTVGTGETYEFALDLVAPPLVSGAMQCGWMMADSGALMQTGLATEAVEISRFPDALPGSPGGWARAYIDACAGRLPAIVLGYPDGHYGPSNPVDRAAMAVFIVRAAELPLVTVTEPTFPDVADTFWAFDYVETLVDAAIVLGYTDGNYHPEYVVTRAQMAVYVDRACTLSFTPADPPVDLFLDIPVGFWAYDEIGSCVENGVVAGYNDNTYKPTRTVDRAQMAVYMQRAFIAPSCVVMVLGGPSTTDATLAGLSDGVNIPGAVGYDGWTTVDDNPTYAYAVFDANLLCADAASDGAWEVTFEYRDADAPTVVVDTRYFFVSPAQVAAAKAAATVDNPYLTIADDTTIAGLGEGDYLLVVSAEDKTGTMQEAYPRHPFTSTYIPPPPPPGAPRPPDLFQGGLDATTEYGGWTMLDQALLSGNLAFLTDQDDVYLVTQTQTGTPPWCDGDGLVFTWTGVTIPAGATDMVVTVDYHIVDDMGAFIHCCGGAGSCCGSWGTADASFLAHPTWSGWAAAYPYGWGLRVTNWAYITANSAWMPQYWDTGPPVGSLNPLLPSDDDIQGGGDTPSGAGFAGHPNIPGSVSPAQPPALAGDQTYVWTATNMTDYISGNSEVSVVFCGGSADQFYVDQLTLGFTVP